MDLILNILDVLLSPLIFAFVFLFLVIAAVTAIPVSTRKRLRRFQKENREYLAGKKVIPVSYFSQEDIAGRRINARLAKQGFVVTGSVGEAAFFILTGRDKYLRYDFTEKGSRIGYLDNDSYGNMLPSMVRLHEDGRSHYMYCTGWTGGLDIGRTRQLFEQLGRTLMLTYAPLAERKSGSPVLLAALAIVIGLAGFTIWTSWDDSLEYAPMVLAKTDTGEVIAASPRILYLFDAEDALEQRIELVELGITGGLSDIQVLENHQLLVGDSNAGVIKRCDLPERKCTTLPGFNGEPLFLRAFQFHYDAQRARIYAADSSRHRLLELSRDGELIRELANSRLLCFPNDPIVVNNKLFLANTNHHEIIEWDLDDGFREPLKRWLTVARGRSNVDCPDAVEAAGMEYFARERSQPNDRPALAFETGRHGRVWPFSVVIDDAGSQWVINGGAGLQYGDVLKISGGSTAAYPERVTLPDEADPIALLPRGDELLIAETEAPAIIRMGLDGRDLGVFGDSEFLAEMSLLMERRRQRSHYRLIGIALTGSFSLLMIGALIVFRHYRVRDIIAQDPAFQTRPA